jgi:hypothetical protein
MLAQTEAEDLIQAVRQMVAQAQRADEATIDRVRRQIKRDEADAAPTKGRGRR